MQSFRDELATTLLWYWYEFLGKVFIVNVGEIHIVKFHSANLL